MANTASLSSGRARRTTIWPDVDDLPRLGADRRDDAVEVGPQLGIAELVLASSSAALAESSLASAERRFLSAAS